MSVPLVCSIDTCRDISILDVASSLSSVSLSANGAHVLFSSPAGHALGMPGGIFPPSLNTCIVPRNKKHPFFSASVQYFALCDTLSRGASCQLSADQCYPRETQKQSSIL